MRISDWSSDVCSSDLLALTAYLVVNGRRSLLTAPTASGSVSPLSFASLIATLTEATRPAVGRSVAATSAPSTFAPAPFTLTPKPLDRAGLGGGKSGSVVVEPGGRGKIYKKTK